ncbi:PTS system mannose/fructose/N-acetylgalactosamine-transporter subunit IIB [Sporolactobacillus laevolacticus]|uniref:PTS system mannose/fructose/N-acetylgalactosamine-transporter subunit IIB n=1 Tax=Sporolactobacillus laevolacticus TaxID=33018 RepID=UPI0025B62548|nr:PTS sugar transporter subunit IIB [Sporolactobacillus laevolacticus]MDN3955608.1 PTS sugar transporter subunit IIB [Sporolactobacillus laevolacticus]
MTIQLARIDQRLIHGIIVNQWAFETKASRLMVIDDAASKDEVLKASMRLSKPAGTGMSIIDTEKAINNFLNHNYDTQRVFIIAKEPSTFVKLLDAGIALPKINVGIIFNENGRENITKFVSVNEEEKQDLKELKSRGVPVTIQYVPTDTEEDINKYI